MSLKPVIASYSGTSAARIRQYLNESVLEVIERVARAPQPRTEIADDVVAELIEMHVLKEQTGQVRLDTAVFLRDDMQRILNTVTLLAEELARRVLACGSAFREAPPALTSFLGGILGLVQGLGAALKQKGLGVDWKSYTGKYAQAKVDFDEQCDILDALGPDVLNKTVFQGERYTAIFIGPGGQEFTSLLQEPASSESQRYRQALNRYLVDAYALLVQGEIQSAALREAAEAAGLYRQGQPRTAVVTHETIRPYAKAIRCISEVAASYYIGQLDTLTALLRATTAGRQGVPPANMSMHLWRYIRRIIAQALYRAKFFTDTIPTEGTLTVFYANDVALIRELLL